VTEPSQMNQRALTDLMNRWLHPRNHFDYIHSRHTVMAIKDWPRLMRRSLELVGASC
jgi:hypothetical protein